MRCLTSGTEIHRVSLLHHFDTAGCSAKISVGTSAETGRGRGDGALGRSSKYLFLGGTRYTRMKYVFLSMLLK